MALTPATSQPDKQRDRQGQRRKSLSGQAGMQVASEICLLKESVGDGRRSALVGYRWESPIRAMGITLKKQKKARACIIQAGLLKLPPECDSNPPCALSPIHSSGSNAMQQRESERRSASVLNGDLIRLAGVEKWEKERGRQSQLLSLLQSRPTEKLCDLPPIHRNNNN